MSSLFGKTPFLRLLPPVIVAISLCSLFPTLIKALSFLIYAGSLIMLLSLLISNKHQFRARWLFGIGLFISLLAIGATRYQQQIVATEFNFADTKQHYVGIVTDIPKTKPRSVACNVKLSFTEQAAVQGKKIILYLEPTTRALNLIPGEEIVFRAKLNRFQQIGTLSSFDYPAYMRSEGFSGSGYVAATDWEKTGRESLSIYVVSQRCRSTVLKFYQSLGLDSDALGFISALTLGYKADMSDTLQEAFRASGTAHVLAVSGLHVGIIYLTINLMLFFLGNRGRPYILRQLLVILFLWSYVFIAGLSPSVIRAAIMLTINCVANINNRKGFSFNTAAAAAFFILIFRPFSLFSASFRLSFAALFAILSFQPKIGSLYSPHQKGIKYIWDLLTISLSAQLGVFPLILYYFGTFPTYFFITNIVVIPLIGLIFYTAMPLVIIGLLNMLRPGVFQLLQTIIFAAAKTLIQVTLRIVYIVETLPSAQLTDHYIGGVQLLLLLLFIYFFVYSLFKRQPGQLIVSLSLFWLLLLTTTGNNLSRSPLQLIICGNNNISKAVMLHKRERHPLSMPENALLPHPKKAIYRLSDSWIDNYYAEESFPLDILIISNNAQLNVERLLQIFDPKIIVLESSIPNYLANRIVEQCERLGVKVHDVSKDGAFSVKF